jgi:hypothetical protein
MPLSRATIMFLAYLVACLAAAMSYFLTAYVTGFLQVPNSFDWWSLLSITVLFAAWMFFVAALPAAIAIIYGELRNKRSALYYALCGVVASMLPGGAGLLLLSVSMTGIISRTLTVSAFLVAAGSVGGVTYWLLAGRDAGAWRPLAPPN